MIDVAIVGAGPVGTLLAAELARHGVSAVLLEQRAEATAGSRAVGVHPVALAAMEASGATDRILSSALRVRVGQARRGGRPLGEVHFDRLRLRHPYVALLPQAATERALAATAEASGAPPAQRGHRVSALTPGAASVHVRAAEASWQARIVVVAGGVRSRALLPMPARGRRYPDRYLMTDCANTGSDGDRAVIHLAPDGVLESFPLPEGRRRYVAWAAAGAGAETDIDTQRLREAVARRTGSDAAADAIGSATAFGVARSHLAALRADRVIAIGDAAHEVSPIGGQGMNLGLIDAVTLAPLVARWLADGEPPLALADWERDRLRAARRSGWIAALNTRLGRPSHLTHAGIVRLALAGPAARLLAHAYAMGFDPAARQFSR